DVLQLVAEGAEIFDEVFDGADFSDLGRRGGGAGLLLQVEEAALLIVEARFDVFAKDGEEGVGREAVVVEPDGGEALGAGERPVDGGLTATLGVALEVAGEEAGGLEQIIA